MTETKGVIASIIIHRAGIDDHIDEVIDKMLNNIGLKTDPYGAPLAILTHSRLVDAILTFCNILFE